MIGLVTILAFMSTSLIIGDAVPVKKISIYDEMKKDTNLCRSFLLNSRYVKNCSSEDFPSGNVTLGETSRKQFLCLAIYDGIYRLCFLDSQSTDKKISLSENATVFDAQVENTLPKNDEEYFKFCGKWKKLPGHRYSRLEPYVNQLDSALGSSSTCLKTCTDWHDRFFDLCSVLASMDDIAARYTVDDSSHPDEAKKSPVKSSGVTGKAESSGISKSNPLAKPEKTTIPGKEIVAEPAVLEKNTKESIAVVPQSSGKSKGEDGPKMVDGSSSVQKPSVDLAPPVDSAKNNEEKKKPPNEKSSVQLNDPTVVQETPVDVSSTKSAVTKVQAGTEVKGAEAAKTNMEIDKIPALSEDPNEPESIISEHTQDDERGAVDPQEDGNELELPPASNEDLNEVPVQTSEKREFVPRMPGLRNDDDSHFFGYFTVISVICIAGYVGYHNKQKIFAMVLEGRRSRGGRGRRRPSTANYRKLDCTLEEAVTSQCNSNVTHVIY